VGVAFESDIAAHPVKSPKQNCQNDVPSMSMDGMLKLADAWTVERAFNDALGINLGWPERNSQHLGSGTGILDDGLKMIDPWTAGRQVPAFNDAFRINSAWPEINNQDLGSGNGFLAHWQGQTPEQDQGRRVTAAEPGSQAPGITVNGVALRLPQSILPSYNQSAMASGSYAQEVLPKVSAGTNLMAERKACFYVAKDIC